MFTDCASSDCPTSNPAPTRSYPKTFAPLNTNNVFPIVHKPNFIPTGTYCQIAQASSKAHFGAASNCTPAICPFKFPWPRPPQKKDQK